MKIMIASDLHGSSFYIEKLIERYEEENCEKLLLLGDLLYFNSVSCPGELFNRKRAISLLNSLEDDIVCVKGNCDSSMDQDVLYFSMMDDSKIFEFSGKKIYVTHGHYYGEYDPPRLNDGDILLTGHTHVPACVNHGFWYLNPGSVSLPKQNSQHGYMTFEDGLFVWKSLDGVEIMSFDMQKELLTKK